MMLCVVIVARSVLSVGGYLLVVVVSVFVFLVLVHRLSAFVVVVRSLFACRCLLVVVVCCALSGVVAVVVN